MDGRRAAEREATSHEGRRIASLFRRYRGLGETRPCALEPILAEDDIEVVESRELDPGYTACLLRNPYGGPGAGILLAPGQERGRRHFSIAHELGHYHIPSHAKARVEGYCADADMRARSTDARVLEWEANEFAAELLMPARLFAADAARLDVSFEAVTRLASTEMYDVSVTAAAWRLVQTTREACALIVSTDCRVEWIARSRSFSLPLVERRQQVSPDTLAASAFRGEGTAARPQPVPLLAWAEPRYPVRGELLESTIEIPRLGQVLSLIWLVGSEDEAE